MPLLVPLSLILFAWRSTWTIALLTDSTFIRVASSFLCALTLVSFVRVALSDAGQIPESWALDAATDDIHKMCVETKYDGSRRICRKSRPPVYKPDRAHFCRMLGRCVSPSIAAPSALVISQHSPGPC